MKNLIIIPALLLLFSGCKKEEQITPIQHNTNSKYMFVSYEHFVNNDLVSSNYLLSNITDERCYLYLLADTINRMEYKEQFGTLPAQIVVVYEPQLNYTWWSSGEYAVPALIFKGDTLTLLIDRPSSNFETLKYKLVKV